MVEKPMPKSEQVVHIWRYWSTSTSEPFTLVRSFKDKEGVQKKTEKVIVDKTTVDEILYRKGINHVNTMQSFLQLLKNASVTKYDKSQDKNNKLKDYGFIPVTPNMLESYEISDKRYEDNKRYESNKLEEIDMNMSKILKDIGNSTDEEKD